MKIIQVTSDYLPNPLWGMGWHVNQLFNALHNLDIEIYVATAHKSKMSHANIITTSESEDAIGLSPNKYEIFNDYERFNKWQIKLAKRILKSKVKFDVIHCHNWMSWLTAKELKKGMPNARIVITFHFLQKQYESMVDNPIPSFHQDIINIEMEAIKNASGVIVLSDSQERLIKEKYIEIGTRLHLIPHSINFEPKEYQILKEVKDNNKNIEIVFVGRIENDKGIVETIHAFNMLNAGSNIKLNIVGEGPLLKELKNNNHNNNIVFQGYVERQELEDILTRSHIFCMPSTSENLPLTVLEAMYFGLVPIFSKGASVPNIFNDKTEGLYVKLFKTNEKYTAKVIDIRNALKLLINDKNLRDKMSLNAYKKVSQNYTTELLKKYLISLYKSL